MPVKRTALGRIKHEAAAVKDVRSAASELAIAAAAQIIDKDVKGAKAASLVDDTISSLRKQLN